MQSRSKQTSVVSTENPLRQTIAKFKKQSAKMAEKLKFCSWNTRRSKSESEKSTPAFKSSSQQKCDFCLCVGHSRRNCSIRIKLHEELNADSRNFHLRNAKIYQRHGNLTHGQSNRPLQNQNVHNSLSEKFGNNHKVSTKNGIKMVRCKSRTNATRVKQQCEQRHSSQQLPRHFHQPMQQGHQQHLRDTKIDPIWNCVEQKSSQMVDRYANYISSSTAAFFRHSKKTINPVTIASLFKLYLARIQPKIPGGWMEENLTCAMDQSSNQIIDCYDCIENHDLSADLNLLFNEPTKIVDNLEPVITCMLSAPRQKNSIPSVSPGYGQNQFREVQLSTIEMVDHDDNIYDLTNLFGESEYVSTHMFSRLENFSINQLDAGQKVVHIIHTPPNEQTVTSLNNMTGPLMVISREVHLHVLSALAFPSRAIFHIFSNPIFIILESNLGTKYFNETTINHLSAAKMERNWKKRKRA